MDIAHSLRSVVVGMPFLVLSGRPKERAGVERLASRKLGAFSTPSMQVDSPAFAEGARIPVRYTADGENISPPLRWSGVPVDTRSLVLLVEDPDAPTPNPFVHWIAILPPRTTRLREGAAGAALEGRNSTLKLGWMGCAPPRGDVAHHYHFQLFASAREIDVALHPGRSEILRQLLGHVIAYGQTVGIYERSRAEPSGVDRWLERVGVRRARANGTGAWDDAKITGLRSPEEER
jgi:Raf kinase inhibitor-like YbhB/YbcL family protein